MKIGDFVGFTEQAECRAAVTCRQHGITGRIVANPSPLYAVDVGFDYLIYAKPHHLQKIMDPKQIPEVIE